MIESLRTVRCALVVVCTAATLLSPIRRVSAQSPIDSLVRAGARVRVVTVSPMNFKGTRLATGIVKEVIPDSLRLQWENDASSTLAYAEISKLHVRVTGRRYVWRGMGAGFLIGTTVGAMVGVATYNPSDSYGDLGIIMSTAGFAFVGTVVGGIAGASGRRDAWERVRLGR